MSIGIVIPAYNAAAFLAHTIDSVIAQSAGDWELVIVDDGSGDQTPAIAQRCADADGRIRVITGPNAGVANARNTGAAALSNGVTDVMFLDHDDVLHRDALEALSQTLAGNSASVAAHGMARKVDAAGRPEGEGETGIQNYHRRKMAGGKIVTAGRDEPTTLSMIVYDNLICTPGQVLIRRAALKEVGLQAGTSTPHPGGFPVARAGRVEHDGRSGSRHAHPELWAWHPESTHPDGFPVARADRRTHNCGTDEQQLGDASSGRPLHDEDEGGNSAWAALLFDPETSPLSDWDLWLRLTQLGDIAYVDRVVIDWRRHESAGSNDVPAMSAAELRIREKLLSEDLPSHALDIALARYRKLLVTRQRRVARDMWHTARRLYREGQVGKGIVAQSRGFGSYARYLYMSVVRRQA